MNGDIIEIIIGVVGLVVVGLVGLVCIIIINPLTWIAGILYWLHSIGVF